MGTEFRGLKTNGHVNCWWTLEFLDFNFLKDNSDLLNILFGS